MMQSISRFIDEKWFGLFQGNLLRITCIAGLILFVLIGGACIAFYCIGGTNYADNAVEGFYRLLRNYDNGVRLSDPEKMDKALDNLEKKAEGVESLLSVLKRRRALAGQYSAYIAAYRQAARRAVQAYPWSEPLAAIAAEAIIRNTTLSAETEAELRSRLGILTDTRYSLLRLSLHILAGDFKNPGKAAVLGGIASANLQELSVSEKEAISADLAILRLLAGDTRGAAAEIQNILSGTAEFPFQASDAFLRFAAEYYYDFGDMQRAAELFSRISDEAALSRQADALWLAGFSAGARLIWTLSSAPRSLYNLALTAPGTNEAAALLERLIHENANEEPYRQLGIIHYSQMLPASQAAAILETARSSPLTDLEKIKRMTEIRGISKTAAETWVLLERYPQEENLYQWGAWFFDFQHYYDETSILLRNAGRHQFVGAWLDLHTALQQTRRGKLDEAEKIFTAVRNTAGWPALANLGRILEANHAPAKAIEQYETAAAEVKDKKAASRIQYRIAQCLKSLGRNAESRRVLEYALDLNPDNLNVRLDLH